jgi:hypothetical protein
MALTQIKLGGLAAESVDSDAYVDGSIDLAHLSADSVDSTQYVDGSIDNAHLADDAVDSDELAAGSVDAAHLAAGVGGVSGITDNSNANAITIDSSENVAIDSGNLVISTHGKGIDFAANTDDAAQMTAEILDDYEEGTWSPVVTDGTRPMSMHGSYDTGYYTKVGNLVTVTAIPITDGLDGGSGNATGNIRITGLPFTVANNSAAYSGGAAGYGGGFAITAGHSVGYYNNINATYITLSVWDATTGHSAMQASEWTADGQLIISFSYRAA